MDNVLEAWIEYVSVVISTYGTYKEAAARLGITTAQLRSIRRQYPSIDARAAAYSRGDSYAKEDVIDDIREHVKQGLIEVYKELYRQATEGTKTITIYYDALGNIDRSKHVIRQPSIQAIQLYLTLYNHYSTYDDTFTNLASELIKEHEQSDTSI